MMSRSSMRPASRAPALLTLTFALCAGAVPLRAQQRVDVTTTRRLPRTDADADAGAERMVRDLKQRADSLARLYGDEGLSVAERQRVGEQLDRTVDALERTLSALEARAPLGTGTTRVPVAPMASARAAEAMSRTLMQGSLAPRGWLGIVVTGAAREPWIEGGELLIRYVTHPEIVSVEPSSPAERAGLAPGDVLIAYDGRDVRDNDISLTRLLKPNARVLVRIGRDGRERDVPVTIADAPSRIMLRRDDMNGTMSLMRVPNAIAVAPGFPRPPAARAPRTSTAMRHTMTGTRAPSVPMAPVPVAIAGLAGAQMGSLTEDWARLTGVKQGVLVMRAPVGSLAAESGLRDADVIVSASGQSVRTLPELRDLIASAWGNGERSLVIQFVRARTMRSGVLRW